MSSRHRYVDNVHLPLRPGQVGRFLGVFNINGRNVGYCYRDRRFTGRVTVRGVPMGARFRNETVGVTFEFNGMWHPVLVADPNGCRYCDASRVVGDWRDGQRDHCQRYSPQPDVGSHGWVEPTDQQRLHRMQWRRYLTAPRYLRNSRTRRDITYPDVVPFTLVQPKKTRRSP